MKLDKEWVVEDKDSSFAFMHWCSDGHHEGILHVHDAYELTVILHGQGQRFIGDHVSYYNNGDVVLLGPGIPHMWLTFSEDMRMDAIVIQIPTERLVLWQQALPELKSLQTFFTETMRGIFFSESTEIIKNIIALETQDSFTRLQSMLALLRNFSELPYDVLASAYYKRPKTDGTQQRRIDTVQRYLLEHFKEDVKQDDVAAYVEMSRSGFSRFFRQAIGKTFSRYLQELRIGFSCERLALSDDAIIDICYESGFNNLSNFNRIFRSLQNMTPREFRSSQRQ